MFVWGSILINALPMTHSLRTHTLADAETVDVWRGPMFVCGSDDREDTHVTVIPLELVSKRIRFTSYQQNSFHSSK